MSDTWHLKLPIIEAAQSQKHVTHNEALLRLDAIVQLAVIDRDRTGPPPGPTEGDRHLIASGATGAWSGKDDQIAHLQDGVWVFLVPQPGWLCWDMDAGEFVAWTGTEWEVIETGASASAEYERFGINTAPDPINRLSVKSDAVLLSHDDVTPGSGDMRVKLNKDTAADTASFLFQTGWSGRAEFGTTGDDDWRVKVSPDGATWLDALIADRASGTVTLPAGLVVPSVNAGPLAGFRNLLINGDFAINQRGFAGGALAADTYGHDRWKADAAGASYTVSAGTITLASGALVQVIESPRLAGIAVTLSLENPSADIGVDIAGETATITAGSGRRGVTLTIPSGSTGDITVKLSATGAAFKRAQLEIGPVATPFERRPIALETVLCQRYYQYYEPSLAYAFLFNNNELQRGFTMPIAPSMRIAPAVATAEENLVVNSIAATKSFLRAQGTATAAASWARFTTIELDAEF